MTTCLETTLRCNELGLVPVLVYERKKRPIGKAWQNRRYTNDDLRERFTNNPNINVGLLLGPDSGVIDIECDGPDSPNDLAELFDGQIPTTPGCASRRGNHYFFKWHTRLAAIGSAVIKWKSVEIRLGTGGKAAQSLLPPSTADGFTRQWTNDLSIPLADVPDAVIDRLLDSVEPEKPTQKPIPRDPVDDDFIRTSDFGFLANHGWENKGNGQWARPGTDKPLSASIVTAEDGTRLLHVFSTNAEPFEADTNYNAFDCYRLLYHNGDRKAARADLVKQGFGRMQIPLITSKELDSNDYNLTYLIDGLMVAAQPLMLAGPKKGMKTSVALALAIALATGKHYLGCFAVAKAVKVIILSGESGMGTLQETARRICKSMGIRLSDLDNLLWSDFLPRFNKVQHLDALERMIQEKAPKVLIVDPAYLCMPGADAPNLMAQGELLIGVSQICQRYGTALVIAHHTRKLGKHRTAADYQPLELDDMSFVGFAEFARQWILLNRREPYEPGTGCHKLWVGVGGSAGHSSLHGLDINEGPAGKPRHWEVNVLTPDDARAKKREDTARQRIVNAAKEYPNGETKTVILDTAGLKSTLATRTVFDSLVNEKVLIPRKLKKNGQPQEAYCLAG